MRRHARVLVLTALAASALVANAAPVAAARSRERAANPFAAASLREYLAGREGNITAAAYDINTRRTYLYRPGVREETASIIKVDILATLLRERQDSGGLSGSEQAVARGMIEDSDNNDATDLWNLAGGAPAVAAFDGEAGMSETTPSLSWGLTMTTPRDQLKLLRLVALPNRFLSRASRRYEYELMRSVIPSQRWGVSGGVPASATVALKNGWLPRPGGWQVNSIGQVIGSGRRYLLAVMTNADPTEEYGIASIEHVATAVWRALRLQTLDRFIPPKPHRRRDTVTSPPPTRHHDIPPRARGLNNRARGDGIVTSPPGAGIRPPGGSRAHLFPYPSQDGGRPSPRAAD